MHLLAVSGSLRANGSNTAVLEAARLLAPRGVDIEMYSAIATLPAFNPDLDRADAVGLPPMVGELRSRIGRADGLLISSPEYAHGVPGAFKNALDWLVGSVEFTGKPVALISTSARSVHVRAQLTEIMTTMSARLIESASITIEMAGRNLDARGIVENVELASVLRASLQIFVSAIQPVR